MNKIRMIGAGLLFGCLAFLRASEVTNAPPAAAGNLATLTVRVTGFRNDQGLARISLFREEKGFPDHAELAFRTNSAPILQGETSAVFAGLPPGDYAVSVLHDENRNGRMDVNWLGRPREGYGVSAAGRSQAGAPAFAASRFRLEPPARTLAVHLAY